jgi:hypothetical protein
MLSTASLSALGYENDLSRPVIRFWNETRHVDIETEVAAHADPRRSRRERIPSRCRST